MPAEASIIIRRAETRDAPALGRLGAALVRAHHAFDEARFLPAGPGVESGYGRFLTSQFDDHEVVILVAEHTGKVVGYVYAGVEPRSWKELRDVAGFIHDVVVDAERNPGAQRLFERLGFRRTMIEMTRESRPPQSTNDDD